MYKQKNYEGSQQEYSKALTNDPKNPIANYNNGNAQFRNNRAEEALHSYDSSIAYSKDKDSRQKAFYNKGVVLSKQQKLEESIEAWKESLKLDPNDPQSRENLQKALMELKKKQEQKKEENKDQKDKKQDEQKKQQEQKPTQPQSKLSKQQVEQLLKALQQKEKEIQQKLQKGNPQTNKPEKDW